MPYASPEELPDSVYNHLPPRARRIYVGAFNGALSHYGNEVTAYAVAWGAVKRKYRKNARGKWVLKRRR